MHLLVATVALASLLTGALGLTLRGAANSTTDLPAYVRIGCNTIAQDPFRRDQVTNGMIEWCKHNVIRRLSIQSVSYADTTYVICNVRSPPPPPDSPG